MAKSLQMASLAPIDVHLCFGVCKMLEFWKRIAEKTFGARLFVAILLFCPSCLQCPTIHYLMCPRDNHML